jgi:hypothetical protein
MCEAAGLRADDVVLEIEGRPLGAPQQLLLYVNDKRPGEHVQFRVWRDRQVVDVDRSMGRRGEVSEPVATAAVAAPATAPTVASVASESGTALQVPPPAAVANPPPPALELDSVRAVPGQVAPGGKFALEVTFRARDADPSAATLPITLRYSIEKDGQTLFAPDPEIVNAANGQVWRVVKSLAATRQAGQYTLRVELSRRSDRAQATTTLTVN